MSGHKCGKPDAHDLGERPTPAALAACLQSITQRADQETRGLRQEDLEQYWFFLYDTAMSPAWNLYQFHSMLELYRRRCRVWEEHHHGVVCVVERVRDRYLMPKIRVFLKELSDIQ